MSFIPTDDESYERLEPVAKNCGWNCFAGSADDVLSRFCRIAEKADADIIVRATGDNPFLFYDAAQASLERFIDSLILPSGIISSCFVNP